MTERPILFSSPMVRAILEGRKTQTRRIDSKWGPPMADAGFDESFIRDPGNASACPYGIAGDTLWVRESIRHTVGRFSEYVADGASTKADAWPWKRSWLPPMHCPRGLSRITLRVMSVRVQRLDEISQEDARDEGVQVTDFTYDTYKRAFARLWDEINGKRAPWSSRPWVWAIGFEVIA